MSAKVRRITIVADDGWFDAIDRMVCEVYPGEVCYFESVSEYFEVETDEDEEDDESE